MNSPAIETRGLQKKYGNVLAVNDLNLRVERGEIFGLVGADDDPPEEIACASVVDEDRQAFIPLSLATISWALGKRI